PQLPSQSAGISRGYPWYALLEQFTRSVIVGGRHALAVLKPLLVCECFLRSSPGRRGPRLESRLRGMSGWEALGRLLIPFPNRYSLLAIAIFFMPPMYDRSASGTAIEPSSC